MEDRRLAIERNESSYRLTMCTLRRRSERSGYQDGASLQEGWEKTNPPGRTEAMLFWIRLGDM
jgi:hypothetical protein